MKYLDKKLQQLENEISKEKIPAHIREKKREQLRYMLNELEKVTDKEKVVFVGAYFDPEKLCYYRIYGEPIMDPFNAACFRIDDSPIFTMGLVRAYREALTTLPEFEPAWFEFVYHRTYEKEEIIAAYKYYHR